MTYNSLLIFALEAEAHNEFNDHNKLFTGVGKINAAYGLMNHIHDHGKPDLLINLGTAGSATINAGAVVQCTKFIQRDMDVTPLGFAKYETPFSNQPPILDLNTSYTFTLPQAICGTGDHFDTAHNGADYDVVDMEAFALAFIARKENIPFLCLKYISDGADGTAHKDWEHALEAGAKAMKAQLALCSLI